MTGYVPPNSASGAEPESTGEPGGYRPPASDAPASPAPQDAPAQSPHPAAPAGYTPPGASVPPAQQPAPSGYVPPAAQSGASSAASASGYTPPASGGTSRPAAPQPTHEAPIPAASAPEPEPAQAPEAPAPAAAKSKVPMIVGIVVLLALVAFFIVKSGVFGPKMTTLPQSVGSYSREAATSRTSGNTLDTATYRAGTGDIYTASLVKNAPDPAAAFNAAPAASRLQQGTVYCVNVGKSGKGADCSVKLSTGSVVTINGSSKHNATDVAAFAGQVAAAVK